MALIDNQMPIIDLEKILEQKEPYYFSKQIQNAKRFYRINNNCLLQPNQNYKVISGGIETCSSGYEVSRSSFPYHIIEFIIKGHGNIVLKGKKWDLTLGNIFFYGPGIPHKIINYSKKALEKYFVNYVKTTDSCSLDEVFLTNSTVFHTSTPHALIQTFEEIFQYGLENTPWSDSICSRLVEILIFQIAQSALNNGETQTVAFRTFLSCRNFIGTNYTKYRTLESISKVCNITSAYLCRLFKKFDHQSPYQYLLCLQMNHAAGILLKDHKPIQEIAVIMGYDDPFHFSRTFKKIIGISPAEMIKPYN